MRAGTELAAQLGATLILVHAFHAEPVVDANGLYLSVAERREDARGDLDHALSNARAILPSATAILVEGEPAEAILGAVAQTRADLLVMGTHGRGGLTRLLLGSVAEKVLRHSPVPVVTISSRTASGE